MFYKNKSNLLLKVLTCFTLLLSLIGAIFSLPSFDKQNISVSAETTDITDTLTLGDWGAPESEPDIRYLWFNDYGGIPTGIYKEWWNDNGATNAELNNGIDIMEYIYIDGESTRSIVTKNQTGETLYKAAQTAPISYGGVFAPVGVFTNGNGVGLKVMLEYKTSFLLTVKAGFQVTNTSGVTYTVSEDVDFQINTGSGWSKIQKYTVTFNDESGATVSTKRVVAGQAVGELPDVPAKDGYVGFWPITEETVINAAQTITPTYALEYQDLFGIEDRTRWGALGDDEYYFGGVTLEPFGYFNTADSVSGCWNVNWDATYAPAYINNNYGVDIMEYIYVNGEQARAACIQNGKDNTYKGANGGWIGNGGVCAPVCVETTNGSGILIRILKAYAGESFTITFKAGFTLTRNDGEVIYLSDDVEYQCDSFEVTEGDYAGKTAVHLTKTQKYTLTFDGVESKRIVANEAIGELPAVPAKDGYEGVWMIDGEEITADTLYTYGADKTATAVYRKDITETIGFGDWGVPEAESDLRYLWIRDNGAEIATAYPNSYWNDHVDNKDSNYGVDIMEYILIDGETVRSIINKNKTDKTYTGTTFPFNNGGCYAPVCIETAGDAVRFKVMVAYKTSFKVTFKAGFTLVNADGVKLYTTEDVIYKVGEATGDITKVTAYTLTFDGVETRELEDGAVIGDLPDIPAKEGCVATGWAIDGVEITADTVYNYGADKTATPIYVPQYTLSFEGLDDTLTVTENEAIGDLPAVPANGDYEGVWTVDGAEITANTLYTYGADKTAVAAYKKDITKYIALEDRAWGAHTGEFYFGVLDMREANAVVSGESTTYYLNSADSVKGAWYVGNDAPITANNGVDIMQYIYLNDKSARELITANANGDKLTNSCRCWLSNPAASPVYVETTNGSGIMIKVLKAYSGDYFEITFKSGFSLINSEGITVYLTKDVTYKYIVSEESSTLSKGELTDEDLDWLNGQDVTLMNNGQEYLTKTTCRLTLPALDPVSVENGLTQTFVGWTTNESTLETLYPAGYKLEPSEAMTLYAVWLGFEMQDGAAVRLTANSSGIRFLVDIDGGGYDLGVEKDLILGAGTFIVATNFLETVDFTHAAFEKYGESYYNDVAADIWKVETGDTRTYTAALVNIPESQYGRSMSARGYLKIRFTSGDGYVYTPYNAEVNARSIYAVATLAYNDAETNYKNNTTILDYVNKVADITFTKAPEIVKNEEAVGAYTVGDSSLEGATFTVEVDGDISSALINGSRLAVGSKANIELDGLLYSVSGFEKVDGGFRFTLGAAAKDGDKQSEETLYFESSDSDLDFFLNDYFKRHSGYVENGENLKVNSVTAGVDAEEFFNHEWLSMSYYWYNSFEGYTNVDGINEDRIAGMREVLSSVPVDDYGYVWSSNDRVRDPYSEISTGEQKMGWPFPNNDTVSTAHWEFNSSGSDSGSWSSNVSASVSDGLFTKNVSNQSSNITFTSNSFSSWTTKKIYTYYAPLLEFEVRIDDATNVEDVYVWYTTSSSTSYSEDKKLSVKEKAFMNYDLGNTSGAYNHVLYLPMYAESAWGESTSTYVKQLKIEIVLKSGTTMSGNVGLNYVRPTLDTRMSNNNSILISSLRTDYDYTGDLEYLKENITRARKAMNFLMQMYDSSRGLKKESYIVGHGGTKESLSGSSLFGYTATDKSIASSISQGYWDILYMPEYDFQSNTYFYKALVDMAYLEDILAKNDITVDTAEATVKTATRSKTHGTCAYSYDLTATANTVLTNLRQTTEDVNHTGFWDATDGRFVAGYASGEGKWYDYGYVAWNLEAIYYGIATEEQATAIMNWLNSESSLYDYVFAPRSNTVSGTDMLNGEYAAKKGEWDFGDNCQYGGAIMYTSFYDLMARIDTIGADNAFDRLQAIQAWYKEVYDYYVANGTDPYEFYRYYYDNKGIQCQGMGTNGSVGLDREFLESFLPVSAVAYGFFGIDSIDGKTIRIAPELPAELTFWAMENLAFNKVKYDLKIYENAIQLTDVRGDTTGLSIQVALDYTAGQTVYVNGIAVTVTDDMIENGKVYVTVDFGATVVEVR